MDDFGRVFFADGKVYRAIQNESKEYCLQLLNSDLFRELNEKKLIPKTVIANITIEGCELVLEHEKLVHTLQHEWTFNMLKNAALMVFQVNEICNKYGFELKDAHTLNVLFRGTFPVWIDFGSISPKKDKNSHWFAYEEFLASFIIPLIFWSENKSLIARKLLESNFHRMATIPPQTYKESGLIDLLKTLKDPYRFNFRTKTIFITNEKFALLSKFSDRSKVLFKQITGRNTSLFSYRNEYDSIEHLSQLFPFEKIEEFIKTLPEPTLKSAWQGYHQKYYSKSDSTSYSARFKFVLELIKGKEEIDSIIDLAGNEGYFSQLLSRELNLKQIILADYDENAIDSAYKTFYSLNSEIVHTLLLNFMFTPDIRGTSKRLQSDLAIALAVTHHLLFSGTFSLQAIFERLTLYSKKYVIVEFMPLGLWGTGDIYYPELPQWYNLNWFRTVFLNYFNIIVEEKLEKNRILFFGEIKYKAKWIKTNL